jgi:hypothetical protein
VSAARTCPPLAGRAEADREGASGVNAAARLHRTWCCRPSRCCSPRRADAWAGGSTATSNAPALHRPELQRRNGDARPTRGCQGTDAMNSSRCVRPPRGSGASSAAGSSNPVSASASPGWSAHADNRRLRDHRRHDRVPSGLRATAACPRGAAASLQARPTAAGSNGVTACWSRKAPASNVTDRSSIEA